MHAEMAEKTVLVCRLTIQQFCHCVQGKKPSKLRKKFQQELNCKHRSQNFLLCDNITDVLLPSLITSYNKTHIIIQMYYHAYSFLKKKLLYIFHFFPILTLSFNSCRDSLQFFLLFSSVNHSQSLSTWTLSSQFSSSKVSPKKPLASLQLSRMHCNLMP